MSDNDKNEAWRRRCSQLEALGIDSYTPQVPPDDSRYPQVQAILTEYKVAIGDVIPVPPGWEGYAPLRGIKTLADLAGWLNDQWTSTLATEMGGEVYMTDALDQAARAVRNGIRMLVSLGMDDRPEPPPPADTLAAAKRQLDDLERWVRQKVKDGWTPSKACEAQAVKVSPAKKGNGRKRIDEYEGNILIKKYLDSHQGANIKDVAGAVGISASKVSGMDAWRRHMAGKKADKPPPKGKERQLSSKILAAIAKDDDPTMKKVMKDDAIWQWLLETAHPDEKAGLHRKTLEEKAALIELSEEQFDEEHAEPDD